MGRPRPVQRNKEILTRYAKGVPVSKLASDYGITVQAIKKVLSTSTSTYWKTRDETANAILHAHAGGLSDADICLEADITEDILMAFYMYHKLEPVKCKECDFPTDRIYRSLVMRLKALGVRSMQDVQDKRAKLECSLNYCEKSLLQSLLKTKGGST